MLETPAPKGEARDVTRAFLGRQALTDATQVEDSEGAAALRQFSLERLMGYGVAHADAVELRGRTAGGERWQDVAADLAQTCLRPPEDALAPASLPTRINRLYRASALWRMSQMMMLTDSDERRDIFAKAAELYGQAARLGRDREKVAIATPGGELDGWLFPVIGQPTQGCAVIIGGVEGWGMDFASLGLTLARRGVMALCLDGPGQGESRMTHRHYLTADWPRAYAAVFDEVIARAGGAPLAFIGNSMGGTVAMCLAALDRRIVALCQNGGPRRPVRPRSNKSFFVKMTAHCGEVDEAAATAIWLTVDPMAPNARIDCPLLVVHGGQDPLVSTEDATALFDWAASADKRMVTYSDGDHCVYNHLEDRNNLMADWVADRLARPIRSMNDASLP